MSSDQAVTDKNVCIRLREEFELLRIKPLEAASLLGVTPKTVSRWQKNIPIPSDKLAVLGEKGIDVLYVLTGARQFPKPKSGIEWITFAGDGLTDKPAWQRTVGYDHGTDTIFVSADLARVNEGEVWLCTKYDATPHATNYGRLYVPAKWLIEEFPICQGECEELIKGVEQSLEEMEVDSLIFEQQEKQREEREGISNEERALIDNYRSLSEEDRRAIRRQSDALAELHRIETDGRKVG